MECRTNPEDVITKEEAQEAFSRSRKMSIVRGDYGQAKILLEFSGKSVCVGILDVEALKSLLV